MTIRASVAIGLMLFLVAPADSVEPTIVVVGDSLSSGFGLGAAPSWVAILEDHLETEAYEYAVVNASIAGDTSTGGLNRLPRLLQRYNPAIVIIAIGGNDGLRGQPVGLLRDNLAEMIAMVLESGAQPLLTGIQIPPNYGLAYTEQFTGVYAELAERFQIPFVEFLMDGVALDPTRMQGDRMHPNSQGQQPMFDNVWVVLADLL